MSRRHLHKPPEIMRNEGNDWSDIMVNASNDSVVIYIWFLFKNSFQCMKVQMNESMQFKCLYFKCTSFCECKDSPRIVPVSSRTAAPVSSQLVSMPNTSLPVTWEAFLHTHTRGTNLNSPLPANILDTWSDRYTQTTSTHKTEWSKTILIIIILSCLNSTSCQNTKTTF